MADVEAAVLLAKLTATQAADLGLSASVGAEARLDVAELLEHVVEHPLGDERRADLDADGRAHDRLDAAQARGLVREHQPSPALSSAAWSDWA